MALTGVIQSKYRGGTEERRRRRIKNCLTVDRGHLEAGAINSQGEINLPLVTRRC